jgi:hypothetical protein
MTSMALGFSPALLYANSPGRIRLGAKDLSKALFIIGPELLAKIWHIYDGS